MKHLDLFSGFGGFSLAGHAAGFTTVAFSEVDKFACAILAHHWPDTPNLGDVSKINGADVHAELITAGSPCQDFSVAGKREGVTGARSGLIFEPLRIAEEMEAAGHGPDFILLENVPGILSSGAGGDLAQILGAYLGAEVAVPRDGWPVAGVVCGPAGVASYRLLDAQYFGVPQRRVRWFCLVERHPREVRSLPVLLEPEGVRRHPPTRREAGEAVTRPLGSGVEGGSGYRNDADTADNLIASAITAREGKGPDSDATTTLIAGEVDTYLGGDISIALDASYGKGPGGRGAAERTVVVAGTLNANHGNPQAHHAWTDQLIAHALRADGFDASEDGTGRGTPLVAIPLQSVNHGEKEQNGAGIGDAGAPMYSLTDRDRHAVAFSCKDHGADAGELAPTLRSMEFDESHANGGGQVAVAFDQHYDPQPIAPTLIAGEGGGGKNEMNHPVIFDTTQITSPENRCQPKPGDPCHPLPAHGHPPTLAFYPTNRQPEFGTYEDVSPTVKVGSSSGGNPPGDAGRMGVRRLTPRECERLQGLADDHTLVPYRGKPAADGPRYRAIGNGIAVPCVEWILRRLALAMGHAETSSARSREPVVRADLPAPAGTAALAAPEKSERSEA